MQPNVVTFIWVGIGFNACLSAFKRAASSKNFFQNFQTIIGLRKETKSSTDKLPPLESNSGCDSIIFFVGILVALGLVLAQCSRFYWIEDQYENKFFHNYAKALIEPLPQNAVLLVNYDMQWTAIRYMQKCIGLRPDITAINLSMMTFAWFKNNHHHYPNIVFPGTFYSSSSTVAVSNPNMPFSMFQFLEANVNSLHRINGTMGGIFLCGKLNFPDKRVTEAYETIPYGLTQTFVRRNSNEALLSPSIFQRQNQVNWKVVLFVFTFLHHMILCNHDA